MEGLPFLPGYTFNDVTRQQHNVSHNFVYKNGYPIVKEPSTGVGGEPLDIEGILYCHTPDPVSYDPSLTYGRTQQHVPSMFKPHFVLYDKKCLAFKAFFKQGVPNSPNEHYRVHHVNLVYFLEDDTMQIAEPTTPDAGYPQGTIVRRCKLPKNTLGEYFHWKDLNNGVDMTANGIVYHICSCDKWTREYLMSQGVEVNEDEPLPKDPYTDRRITENTSKTYKTPPFADKFYKFLVYDKKVLRFTGVWDDRDSEYGTIDKYSILYYLADDTFEIHKLPLGREKELNPVLLSKTKIPKNWKHTGRDFPSIYLEKCDKDLGGFYSPDDLVIGNTIFIFGRRFLIIDCDKATRDFYNDVLHVEQPQPISIGDEKSKEIPVRPLPKYTGIGTHEDSIQSFYTFNPQPPKLDLVRYLLNMSKVLRYTAVMDVVHPDDALRSFIIQYRLSDGYLSINEEKMRNTGFLGGTFLKYTLIPKFGSNPDNPEYLTPADFYLGATVNVFSHRFVITGVDLAVYRYMETNPTKFRKEVIDEIRKDLIRKNLLTEDVKEVADFRKREEIAEPMFEEPPECNAAVGVKAFFDMMHESPQKVMLFGAACTQVTDPIAKASKRWHLTQLSYADTHPMFTSDHFPNFYRVVPSENAFNAPRLELMRQFNWTRVGTIYQNEPRYSLAHNRLVADLDQQRFEVEETQSFTNEVATAISKLKEKDIRIVLGNFNETWARHIFCEAHSAGMTGRKYQWLIMGTYGPSWWLEPAPCPSHTLAQALDGVILTDLLPLATSGEITISGITADEYKEEYDSRRGNEYSRFHGYTYDGVWAVALAIQHVTHRVRHFRKDQTVVDFQYRDPLWERLFIEALKNTSFEGVTGPVRFYDNERKASILLKQFQNGTEVKVGEYNAVNHDLDLDRGQGIRWSGRGPPKDRTLQILEHSHVNVAIYSSLAAVASLGIILATVFLAINIKFRNQRYIKMSSPYLNNLIIIGSILTYSSVIFLGLDSRMTSVQAFPYICTARAWLLMAGFSLAFGAMFSKTWRVHSIFTDVKLNKKVIKDYQLYMVVGVLLAVDLGIMTTWQVADPFFRSTKLMEPYPHPHSEDIIIYPENEYCRSHYMNIFVGIIYAYKGLLMIFGAFLAWETRHVSIPALNDSKYVGMSVYNVVLMCIMGAAVSFVLSDEQNAAFVLISFFTIFCATITLCLVFVPKLVELRRNPQGVIDKRIRATLRPTSKTRRDSSELEEKFKEAKNSNQRWRKMLLERENELQNLLKVLGAEDKVNPPAPQEITQLKKEPPSGTETTEISSVCSNTSSHEDRVGGGTLPMPPQPAPEYASVVETPAQQKKKTTFSTAPTPAPSKLTSNSTAPTSSVPVAALEEMTVGHEIGLSVISESRQSIKTSQHSPSSHSSSKAVSWEECPRGSSNSLRRRSSGVRTSHTPPPQRRTSMPGRRTPTFVHQDELWLTQTRHCRTRCSNPATNEVPDDDVSVIQRSVSERREKCCHGGSSTLPSTGSAATRGTSSLKKPTPAQFQSTPNVLGTALSEGELLDLSILPIFQKLLTERRGAAIASCPNIAIKCDIVEYL